MVPVPGGAAKEISVGLTTTPAFPSCVPFQCTTTDAEGKNPSPLRVIVPPPDMKLVPDTPLMNGAKADWSFVVFNLSRGTAGPPLTCTETAAGSDAAEGIAKRTSRLCDPALSDTGPPICAPFTNRRLPLPPCST